MDPDELTVKAFVRHLRHENKSDRTVQGYCEAVRQLSDFLGDDRELLDATRDDIREFTADLLASRSPATAANRFRSLQAFYKFAVADDLAEVNPTAGLRAPVVPEKPVPVVPLPQLRTLLDACQVKGKPSTQRNRQWHEHFTGRRDEAMIRLMLEPGGMRVAEVTGLTLGDVDFENDTVLVVGKGRRVRAIPFGYKSGRALTRYLAMRAKHGHTRLPNLWLAQKGAMTISGVAQMLERRCAQAGIPRIRPHQLRHTAADMWLAESGGDETSAMRLFGWKSRAMLQRYGSSNADRRARDAARKLSLGDKL